MVVFRAFGGMDSVGARNSYGLIQDGSVYMLDCGMEIPNEGYALGDAQFPDFESIFRDDLQVEGVFISHAHLDHIGGLNYFYDRYSWERSNEKAPPLITSEYSGKVIKALDNSYKAADSLIAAGADDYGQLSVGRADVKFFPVIHSIYGSLGAVIELAGKRIVYLGDLKLEGYDLQMEALRESLESIGHCDALLLDATGADRPGRSGADYKAAFKVIKAVENASSKTFVTTFASNMPRLKPIFTVLQKFERDRPIVVAGGSLRKHLKIASENGWHSTHRLQESNSTRPVIFLTGSQGEPNSALTRLAKGELNGVELEAGDTVIFSASTIPDNIPSFVQLVEQLLDMGAKVHLSTSTFWQQFEGRPNVVVDDYHVSGHAFRDDMLEIAEMVNPERIIPVHADYERRKMAAELLSSWETSVPQDKEDVIL